MPGHAMDLDAPSGGMGCSWSQGGIKPYFLPYFLNKTTSVAQMKKYLPKFP